MKAFLCADFSPDAMSKIDLYIGDLSGKRVLLITTAAIGEGFLPDGQKNDEPFISRGASVTRYDIAGKTNDDVTAYIKEADIVCVAGGNTFYLLQHLKACDFKSVLSEGWAQDKIYIGSSAGSIVAYPDIEFIKPMDDPSRANLDDTRGFGWVDFLFLPHWKTPTMPAMARAAEDIIAAHDGEIPMMAFEDHQVVYLPDVRNKTMIVL
jgi:dipeptidase E